MILKKCTNKDCKEYNLTDTCKSCKSKTQLSGHKFIKLKDESDIHPKFLSFRKKQNKDNKR